MNLNKENILNVLVSDISGFKAVVVCKYLKKNYDHFRIFTYDKRRFTKYFRTRYSDKNYYLNTKENSYIKNLNDIITNNNIQVFIPTNSNEMNFLLDKKSEIGKAIDYWGSYQSFVSLNEKDKLHQLASKLNIRVPKVYNSMKDAQANCVVKPKNLSSSKGVKYFFDQEKIEEAIPVYDSRTDIIIQEYVQGAGVGYSVFAKNGEVMTGFGHRRLAEYPISGGSSVYRESYINEQMHEIAIRIVKATNWSGFAMFEFKLTSDNELYLLEVNPRIWGSINQGLQNGTNYFTALFGDAKNKVNEKNVNTFLSPLIYVSFMRYIIRFNFKPVLLFIRNIRKNKPDVSFFDDFGGWFSILLRKVL